MCYWFIIAPIVEQFPNLFFRVFVGRQYTPLYFNTFASVRASRVVFFERCINSQVLPARSAPPVISGKKTETLSYKANKRLQDAINLLVLSAKPKTLYSKDLKSYFRFRVNFVTLTLPSLQCHPDKEIHNKVFKDFIRAWKRKSPGLLYVWKAEVQDNGNLHYHLTTNSFLHYRKLRNMWNRACNLLGYMDRCSVTDPNSTDVHAVKNIKNLGAYLCSYVSKKDLYKTPLKRWFRRHGKKLKALTAPVFVLPKNYFSMFKRRVEIKLWDASKVLLSAPLVLNLSGGSVPGDSLDEVFTSAERIAQYDYCRVAYTNVFGLKKENVLLERYSSYLKELESYSSSVVHELEPV